MCYLKCRSVTVEREKDRKIERKGERESERERRGIEERQVL